MLVRQGAGLPLPPASSSRHERAGLLHSMQSNSPTALSLEAAASRNPARTFYPAPSAVRSRYLGRAHGLLLQPYGFESFFPTPSADSVGVIRRDARGLAAVREQGPLVLRGGWLRRS